jgi:hypothetical protein
MLFIRVFVFGFVAFYLLPLEKVAGADQGKLLKEIIEVHDDRSAIYDSMKNYV